MNQKNWVMSDRNRVSCLQNFVAYVMKNYCHSSTIATVSITHVEFEATLRSLTSAVEAGMDQYLIRIRVHCSFHSAMYCSAYLLLVSLMCVTI